MYLWNKQNETKRTDCSCQGGGKWAQGHQRAPSGQRLQSVLLFHFIPLGWANRSQPIVPPCWWARQNSSPVKTEDRGPPTMPITLDFDAYPNPLALKVQTTIWKMLFSLNLYSVVTLERWEIVQVLFCKTFYVKLYLQVPSCLWASILLGSSSSYFCVWQRKPM